MASPQDKTSRQAIIAALADGTAAYQIPGKFLEPDAPRIHPLEDFAAAWLLYWRALGHGLIPQGGEYRKTWFAIRELGPGIPEDGFMPFLPPHLRLWDRGQHDGATRAVEGLLRIVPGAREAVYFLADREC